MKRKGDYGLNIDTDVALWLDSRDFHKKHYLYCALGFVIVNSQVQDDFDKFKKAEALKYYSLLESLELLDLWCSSRKSSRVTVNKMIACVGGSWSSEKVLTYCIVSRTAEQSKEQLYPTLCTRGSGGFCTAVQNPPDTYIMGLMCMLHTS